MNSFTGIFQQHFKSPHAPPMFSTPVRNLEYKLEHPILLPKNGHITSVIIDFYHRKVGHGGRRMTIKEIRSNGFWVINCTAAKKSMFSKCVLIPENNVVKHVNRR